MADAKQGKASSVEDFCNGSTQSRVVLAKPRLGGFGMSNYATSSNKTSNPFVLRPPQLKTSSNPFAKASEPSESLNEVDKDSSASTTDNRLKESTDDDTPKFVPLGTTANVTQRTTNSVPASAQPPTSTSSSGFVFGQNLSERVFMKEKMNNGDSNEHSSSNGASDLLFTNAAVSSTDGNQEPTPEPSSSGEGLAAAAAEYERSHARPPPLTTNVTTTGEEDEINVLQISCRLFAWESGSWRERGRGVLRLNDAADGGAARLVARVAGSLRVVLNTKLWPDMVVEKAGTKSLRITASDAQQQVKLFLIMAAPSDIVHLYRALLSRIASSKKIVTSSQKSTSQQAAERLEAAADDDEFTDCKDQSEGSLNDLNDPSSNVDDKDSSSYRQENPQIKIDNPEDDIYEDTEAKALKRKEPTEADVSSKRQCPEV